MKIISTSQLEGTTGSCRYCDADRLTAFNWKYAGSWRHFRLRSLRAHLVAEAVLKWGTLLRCRTCGQAWYLDGDEGMATRVPRPEEARLQAWSATPIPLTAAHVAALERIRAAGADQYGNDRGYLRFPCAIEWADGSASDPAMLVVTKFPPLGDGFPDARLFDPSARLLETDVALPLAVRCATRRADEQRMGFAPTAVEDPAARLLLLNWSADLFDHDGVKGKDVRLSSQPWTAGSLPPLVSEPRAGVTFAFADWFAGADALLTGCQPE